MMSGVFHKPPSILGLSDTALAALASLLGPGSSFHPSLPFEVWAPQRIHSAATLLLLCHSLCDHAALRGVSLITTTPDLGRRGPWVTKS